MIVLACIRLAKYSSDELGHPAVGKLDGIPNLFGACIYSFMCHHSLPSLVTPISPKRHIYRLFTSDYVIVAGFYLLLAFTGIFAFPVLNDLYTLNFIPDRCSSLNDSTGIHHYSSGAGEIELRRIFVKFEAFVAGEPLEGFFHILETIHERLLQNYFPSIKSVTIRKEKER